jgi:hypothetical protein
MNKLKIARALNAIICFTLTVLLMREVYFIWSMHGPYTLLSFVGSLIFHGGFGVVIYLGIDWVLKKLL